jgi:hypothetical protein
MDHTDIQPTELIRMTERFGIQRCSVCGHYAFGRVIHVTDGLHVPMDDEEEDHDD